jgi:hypothetical protein
MLRPSDFNSLSYNVVESYEQDPKADLLQKFPKLTRLKSFKSYGESDRNYLIRFIVIMYDSGSPLADMYPDIEKRKIEAAKLAGYETGKTGAFKDKKIQDVFELKNDDVLEMICEYMESHNSMEHRLVIMHEQAFSEYERLVMTPIDQSETKDKDILTAATTKTKLMKDCDEIHSRLLGYYQKLYNNHDEVIDKAASSRRFRPETVKVKNAASN